MISLEFASGAAALALSLGSYAFRSHKALTSVSALAVTLWALHFGLKGVHTAAAVGVLMALRIVLSLYTVHRPAQERLRWTLGVLLVMFVAILWTWQGWVSAPSALASLWLTIVGLNMRDAQLRLGFLVSESLWLANAWVSDSWFAGVAALAALAINVVALWRYHPEVLQASFWRRAKGSPCPQG